MFRPIRKFRQQLKQLAPGNRNWRLLNLYRSQDGRCALCGGHMQLRVGHDNTATIDHRLPLARGGTDRQDNLQAACQLCNNRKADNLVTRF